MNSTLLEGLSLVISSEISSSKTLFKYTALFAQVGKFTLVLGRVYCLFTQQSRSIFESINTSKRIHAKLKNKTSPPLQIQKLILKDFLQTPGVHPTRQI